MIKTALFRWKRNVYWLTNVNRGDYDDQTAVKNALWAVFFLARLLHSDTSSSRLTVKHQQSLKRSRLKVFIFYFYFFKNVCSLCVCVYDVFWLLHIAVESPKNPRSSWLLLSSCDVNLFSLIAISISKYPDDRLVIQNCLKDRKTSFSFEMHVVERSHGWRFLCGSCSVLR